MKYIWGSLFAGILALGFINAFIIRFSRAGDFLVIFHIVLTVALLLRYKKGLREILLLAFLARVMLMVWDLNLSFIFLLPNSGADTEMYYSYAQQVSRNVPMLLENIRGGPYSKIVGTVFWFTGISRMLGQYINVLLGLSVVVIVHRITGMLKLSERSRRITLLLAAFFPNTMVMSAIFLREIFPTFFVAASLYYFCRWFLRPRMPDMIFSLLMLALASIFHSGVVGIFLGYAYAFLFYKHRAKRFAFSARSVSSFLVLAGVVYLATNVFQEQLFGKFRNIDEIEDVYQTANTRLGGSVYLKGMEITNLWQFFLYGPVKMLYFLAAPMPWDWRGGMDIFTFFADSMFYLYVIVMLFRNRKLLGERKPLIRALALMLLGAVIIFGIGVSNAGTAVRHRQKLIPIMLVSLGIVMDCKVGVWTRFGVKNRGLFHQPTDSLRWRDKIREEIL